MNRPTTIEYEIIQPHGPKAVGKDNHTLAYGAEDSIYLYKCSILAGDFEEALKFSKCKKVLVDSCTIYGGLEDCLDIVRGVDYSFYNCSFIAGDKTQQCVTVKGGANRVLFNGCSFYGKPAVCYIQLGDYTIYDRVSRPHTRNVTILDCYFDRTDVLAWRSLYADKPSVIVKACGTPVSRVRGYKIPNFLMKLYFKFVYIFFDKQKVDPAELIVQDFEK